MNADIIEVDRLCYRYPGQQSDTLTDLTFAIRPGEIFGFLGPSGSGKSTTQKLLIGLLENFSGSINSMGKPLPNWGPDYYQHLGVGFELPNHFSKLTGRENLQLFESFYGRQNNVTRDIDDLLGLVELDDAARQLVAQYSKGMKMRLNFARALLNNPDILFLDEPTAGLDPVTARRLKNIILDLKREGKTIFLTTHNMHDADELCDRVGFIVEGRLQLIGEPAALKRERGERKLHLRYLNADGTLVDRQFDLAGLGDNEEFLGLLRGAEVESMHSQEASLEEVFIAVTGKQLI